MADVVLPDRPALAIIPDVPLVDAGENWPLMTDGVENGTFTSDDIAAAIAALDDPSIRSPRIKLGHSLAATKAMGDGVGTWGRVPAMWTKNEGMTLACNFVGVPIWLAEVMPYAWDSRSIEGRRNVVSDTGKTHALVIDAVSLLGDTFPAISTLDEVRAVWGARALEELPFRLELPMPTVKAARPPVALAAGTTTEDVRRAYYDQLDGPMSWWWIREMELDPLTLIVDDDEGGLWRVPVTVSGEAITFGEPQPVRVEYVPVAAGATTSASRASEGAIVFASRTESREGVAGMDPVELRKSLGLAEDATDDDVMARAAELAARPEPTDTGDQGATGNQPASTPTTGAPPASPPATPATGTGTGDAPPAPVTPPPGFTLIADANLAELQQGAAAGLAASQTLARQAEDAFIARHRARIGPTTNPAAKRTEDHLRREWQRNQGEAEAFASILPERMATAPNGHEGGGDEGVASQFGDLIGAVWPSVAAVRAEREKRGT